MSAVRERWYDAPSAPHSAPQPQAPAARARPVPIGVLVGVVAATLLAVLLAVAVVLGVWLRAPAHRCTFGGGVWLQIGQSGMCVGGDAGR